MDIPVHTFKDVLKFTIINEKEFGMIGEGTLGVNHIMQTSYIQARKIIEIAR